MEVLKETGTGKGWWKWTRGRRNEEEGDIEEWKGKHRAEQEGVIAYNNNTSIHSSCLEYPIFNYLTFVSWLTRALALISRRTTSMYPLKHATISAVHPLCMNNDEHLTISSVHTSHEAYSGATMSTY